MKFFHGHNENEKRQRREYILSRAVFFVFLDALHPVSGKRRPPVEEDCPFDVHVKKQREEPVEADICAVTAS